MERTLTSVDDVIGAIMRVKILPGTAFVGPEPGWFRLCHATDASTVATGINRLIRALETS